MTAAAEFTEFAPGAPVVTIQVATNQAGPAGRAGGYPYAIVIAP